MENNLSVKQKITLLVLSIGMFILSLAVSYAYFSAKINGNESTSTMVGTAAYLELTFTDGESTISGTNLIPGWSASKTFSVSNTGEKKAYYKLKISNITNALIQEGLSFSISSNDGGENINKRAVLTTTRDISLPIEIDVGVTHNYTITTYYDNLEVDQSADLGKSFTYTISIESTNGLVGEPLHWSNPGESTLLSAIKTNYPKAEAPNTIPGQEISFSMESEIASALDDYGTSYYFRGNIQNNYVLFANKCWRIVRVDGNGNIKLWLWNDANNCNSKQGIGGLSRGLFQYTNRESYTAYVGFMYGNLSSNDFATSEENGVHDNLHDSHILGRLKTWYDSTFQTSTTTDFTNLLADVIWCGDKKLVSGSGIGINSHSFYGYFGRVRMPNLVCQDAILNDVNNVSRYTAYSKTDINNQKGNGKLKSIIDNTTPVQYKYYKVGLITADEVTFAGGKGAAVWNEQNTFPNSNYYLYTGSIYWTMTPLGYNVPEEYLVNENGFIKGAYTYNYEHAYSMRPAISLIPSVTLKQNVANQDGTKEHPFEIYVPESSNN